MDEDSVELLTMLGYYGSVMFVFVLLALVSLWMKLGFLCLPIIFLGTAGWAVFYILIAEKIDTARWKRRRLERNEGGS